MTPLSVASLPSPSGVVALDDRYDTRFQNAGLANNAHEEAIASPCSFVMRAASVAKRIHPSKQLTLHAKRFFLPTAYSTQNRNRRH